MYTNLTGEESVHLSDWPTMTKNVDSAALTDEMKLARMVVEVGHAVRSEQKLKLKQPLSKATYSAPSQLSSGIEELVRQELNVLSLQFGRADKDVSVAYDTQMTDELRDMGEAREIVRAIQAERKKIGCELDAKIAVTLPAWPVSQTDEIKRLTLATDLTKGNELRVEVVS